jgi:anaerobic magnesium-protoporphyrin IX monomethyl ester cyclase
VGTVSHLIRIGIGVRQPTTANSHFDLDLVLINPPSALRVYAQSRIKAAIPVIPLYSIALLAAEVRRIGQSVSILNLGIEDDPVTVLKDFLSKHHPRFAGITFATPLYPESVRIAAIIREMLPDTILVGGGVHPTSLPEETLRESVFDVVFIGEADENFPLFLDTDRSQWGTIPGIAYRDNGSIFRTEPAKVVKDLDSLPFPAWDLFDLRRYRSPRITSRKNPVGSIITSRGCVHQCIYCNKNVLGHRFRALSPERVVDEMEFTLKSGFREIHVWDDQFATNLKRAKQICELIIRRGLKFPWNIFNGVRVTSPDDEFLSLAKRAGCYSISFGIESGNQAVLDSIKKGITLDECRRALKLMKKHGLESVTYFMIGLPNETVESLEQTIDFACELDADYAKVAILVPLPDTEVYRILDEQGRITSRDWSQYNFHLSASLFEHPVLSREQLSEAYYRFYRRFYFRPRYIGRRLIQGIVRGRLFHDFYYMIKTFT